MKWSVLCVVAFAWGSVAHAQTIPASDIDARVEAIAPRVVEWRRDIHAHPELGNRETRTSRLVARHLRRLGMDVREGVAHTGVIGVLHGAFPGPTVALRADMDALPVQEQTGLPYASRVTTEYNGRTVSVSHACGHDMHTSMLMGAAEVLAELRSQLHGNVVFIFQPAEEGAPSGERGGAPLMVAENALADPRPGAVFGLHVVPGRAGDIAYRPEGFMAHGDEIQITLHGLQTHGSMPWRGVDIISLTSAVISEFNTIAARTVDVTRTPTILTISTINAGVRFNIIPDTVEMTGTLRTFDAEQRLQIIERMRTTLNALAGAYGAQAELRVNEVGALTYNDPALSTWALGPLREAAGQANVDPSAPPITGSEDFPAYGAVAPTFFFHLGVSPDGVAAADTAPNHSPLFSPNEAALPIGVRAHVFLAVRWLESNPAAP